MTNGEEIAKAFWRTLAEISRKEKEKAIRYENYEDALVAGFLEGLFLEAEKSL
jgi:hypothetical protein